MGIDVGVGGWGLGVGLHSTLPTIVGASFFRKKLNEATQKQPSTLNPQPSVHFLSPKKRNLVSALFVVVW